MLRQVPQGELGRGQGGAGSLSMGQGGAARVAFLSEKWKVLCVAGSPANSGTCGSSTSNSNSS